MKNLKLLLFVFLFCFTEVIFSQNVIAYSNLSQTVTAESNNEVSVKVMASCTGSSSTSVLINPTYCVFDNGLTGVDFSNGTYLLPGQKSEITFRFKKTVSSDQTFTYKFSTNSSCFQDDSKMIKITVNYKKGTTTTNPPTCNLPIATGVKVEPSQYSIKISWNKVPGARSYTFSYYKVGVPNSTVLLNGDYLYCDLNICTQEIFNLHPGSAYDWQFRAECVTNPEKYYSGNFAFGTTSTLPGPPCPTTIPTNLNAIPFSGAWRILFTPVSNVIDYTMEYVDLVKNTSGVTEIHYSATPDHYYNFFYNVPSNHSFKFRFLQNCAMNTDWVTIIAPICQRPTNLLAYSSGGTGTFNWTQVINSQKYMIEYIIYNVAGQQLSGSFTSVSNEYSSIINTNSVSGAKFIKFRVKSQCVDGSFTDFSSWSTPSVWN